MATVTKDFKVKSGLVVEGATATVNNYDVLTKKQEDQDYIVDLIGGTATPENTPDTVVKRDGSGNFVAAQIELSNQLIAPGVIIGDAGFLSDEGVLALSSAQGGSTEVTADQNVTISTGSGDINLNADGTTKIWGQAVATQAYADGLAVNYDAAGSATTAENNAKSYADSLATNYDAAGSASAAQAAAEATASADATSKANAAQAAAEEYADNKINDSVTTQTEAWSSYKTNAEIGNAQNAAQVYADNAVAALIDQAPAMLDTLNELAAALGDDADFIGTVNSAIGEKVTKSGDTMTGELVLAADPTQALAAATKQYVDAVGTDTYNDALAQADQNAQGYATTAENNAKGYADGLATNYDAAGAATTAETNANTYTDNAINALTTDDIPEENLAPVNRYFTDARAKTAAADLLTSANLTNITITGDGNGITIAAENGVAGSDTDDLAEGSNNLYFTDARAVSALEAVVPNFTEIDLNNIVTNVATQATVATASQVTAHEFDSAVYRSAEYTVKVAYGSHTELSKVIITLDSADNIAITEYAVVGTNGSASTITADVNGGNVRLRVTTANNNSIVTVFGTIIK